MEMENHGTMGGSGNVCRCGHHRTIPLIVAIIGALFLLERLGILTSGIVSLLWPIGLIAIGVFKMHEGSCKCCGGSKW